MHDAELERLERIYPRLKPHLHNPTFEEFCRLLQHDREEVLRSMRHRAALYERRNGER